MTGARLADLPAVTPERVLELKAEAKATREATGAKHTSILAQIAEREGFPSWERLCARAGGRAVVDETKRADRSAGAQLRAQRHADHESRQLAREDAAMGRDLERAAKVIAKSAGGAGRG